MGSKRVGLARVQSLIQNLKRELDLTSTQLNGLHKGVKTLVTGGAGTTVVTAEDSGKVIFVDGSTSGNHTITLPPPTTIGLEYIFVLNADNHSGTKILLDSQVSGGIKGMLKVLAASAIANVVNHSNQKLGFGALSKIGSTIHIVSSGNFYHIVEAVSDVTHITAFGG
jgi:hypothetical protein|tara:strand:+ start:231 stop:734 length:504 start_codon:yes stop_codon:yes gene_type:complete